MKCIIIDDEPLAHQVLEHYIDQTPDLELTAKFRNAVEAFEYLQAGHATDLLFLDIEMPLVNGIHFLKALKNPPPTIFTTAYKQYAYEGFELEAVDYLLKPFAYDRFIKAVQKARKGTGTESNQPAADTLLIKDTQGSLLLKQADIFYLEGCRDYVKIVTADKTHVIYHTLKGLVEKLNPEMFIQAHRSYIVNKTLISRVVQDNLIFVDQSFIPIGPNYKKALLAHLSGR